MSALDYICLCAYCKVMSFVKDEKGAVDIVAVVVLIGIAVALAVIFRKSIQSVLESLFTAIEKNATTVVG